MKNVSRLALAITASIGISSVSHAAIEEIVVTAQRTSESIQDVPIAVSAFD
ncbi:MAG: hypothetical protein O3B72_12075 [Proteobacteria bacterium]|nr:hypothetical protein [Pseudomonadota bacterium]